MARPPLPYVAYMLAVAAIVLDQLSKFWILGVLSPGESMSFLPFLKFTLTHNTGASYGLFSNFGEAGRWLLSVFAVVVAGTLAVWVWKAEKWLSAIGVGLIIGGAIGNLIDRVRLGHVIDFLDAGALKFPYIFNVADSWISIGVVLFLLELVLTPDKKAVTPVADEPTL